MATFARNDWLPLAGMGGAFGQEYALKAVNNEHWRFYRDDFLE